MLATVLIVALAAPAGFDRQTALGKYLAATCATLNLWRGMEVGMGERSVCALLHEAKPAPRTFEAAAALIERDWQIPAEAAVPLLEAELYSRTLSSWDRSPNVPWVRAQYERAVAAAPGAREVIEAVAAALCDGVELATLQKALDGAAHPAEIALALLKDTNPAVKQTAAAVALAQEPGSIVEIVRSLAAEFWLPLAFQLTLLEKALAAPSLPAATAVLARATLERSMKHSVELTLDVWARLPSATRQAALDVPQLDLSSQVFALAMRAALVAAKGDANTRLPVAGPIGEPTWSAEKSANSDCTQQVLEEALLRNADPTRTSDAYRYAVGLNSCYRGPAFVTLFLKTVPLRHASLRAKLIRNAQRQLDARAEGESFAFSANGRERMAAAQAKTLAMLRSQVSADDAPPEPERQREAIWVEARLPSNITPAGKAELTHKQITAVVPRERLPRGYFPVRVERGPKNELWFIGSSQNIDPVGETGMGGYWLLHSTNGGQAWSPPIYTGLRENQPYVITSTSRLPLISKGHITIEVRANELDPETIAFPPIDLGFRRVESGLTVQTTLAELTKDSDQDGLSDLVEERLMTNPAAADTDADGLNDGEDSFPNVPAPMVEPPAAVDLLTAVFAALYGPESKQPAIVVGGGGGPLEQAVGRPAAIASDHAAFVIGARADFVGVRSRTRVIVLTNEEADRASKTIGLLYPTRIVFVIDDAGENAQVTWSESWRGGSYDARRVDGRWVLELTSSWVT